MNRKDLSDLPKTGYVPQELSNFLLSSFCEFSSPGDGQLRYKKNDTLVTTKDKSEVYR
ncbi:MAG: hypothetical protein M3O68_05440 [Thermoproteota archaeon]|nr:hypothetical protein [Thermoproteota archaeon]